MTDTGFLVAFFIVIFLVIIFALVAVIGAVTSAVAGINDDEDEIEVEKIDLSVPDGVSIESLRLALPNRFFSLIIAQPLRFV